MDSGDAPSSNSPPPSDGSPQPATAAADQYLVSFSRHLFLKVGVSRSDYKVTLLLFISRLSSQDVLFSSWYTPAAQHEIELVSVRGQAGDFLHCQDAFRSGYEAGAVAV